MTLFGDMCFQNILQNLQTYQCYRFNLSNILEKVFLPNYSTFSKISKPISATVAISQIFQKRFSCQIILHSPKSPNLLVLPFQSLKYSRKGFLAKLQYILQNLQTYQCYRFNLSNILEKVSLPNYISQSPSRRKVAAKLSP